MKIWIQITLHSTEHRDVYVQYNKMHGYGLYSTNDNDNQASTTIWQETTTTKKKKHDARHRWRCRERERKRAVEWLSERIETKKSRCEIKRKRKCARGFLCASSLYNIICALSWCSAFLYSSLLSAVCNGLKIQESRETNRNSRSPNEKGQTLEEKANKHPTNQPTSHSNKKSDARNEWKQTNQRANEKNRKKKKNKIKWIYAYARIEMKQHTIQNKHWVKGIEVQSTFYAQWHWAVVSIVSLIWCGSFNVLAIVETVETGATHSFSFSYWSIKFIFMCFLHLLVYMLTFFYIHSRWRWGLFVCVFVTFFLQYKTEHVIFVYIDACLILTTSNHRFSSLIRSHLAFVCSFVHLFGLGSMCSLFACARARSTHIFVYEFLFFVVLFAFPKQYFHFKSVSALWKF